MLEKISAQFLTAYYIPTHYGNKILMYNSNKNIFIESDKLYLKNLDAFFLGLSNKRNNMSILLKFW